MYNPTTQVMVSFDDAVSFSTPPFVFFPWMFIDLCPHHTAAKGVFIREAGLAGFAMWQSGGDSDDYLDSSYQRGWLHLLETFSTFMFLNTVVIEWTFHISHADDKACFLCRYTFATSTSRDLEFVSKRQTLFWNGNMCGGVTESDQSCGGIRIGTVFDSSDQRRVCDISESRPRGG